MSLLAGVDQKILEYETTNGKGGGRDEASFELRHISASSSDDDIMMARLYSRHDVPRIYPSAIFTNIQFPSHNSIIISHTTV